MMSNTVWQYMQRDGQRGGQNDGTLITIAVTQVSKSRLMGFGNCAPEEDKHLRVQFLWHGRPHAATLADQVCAIAFVLGTWAGDAGCLHNIGLLEDYVSLQANLHPGVVEKTDWEHSAII